MGNNLQDTTVNSLCSTVSYRSLSANQPGITGEFAGNDKTIHVFHIVSVEAVSTHHTGNSTCAIYDGEIMK